MDTPRLGSRPPTGRRTIRPVRRPAATVVNPAGAGLSVWRSRGIVRTLARTLAAVGLATFLGAFAACMLDLPPLARLPPSLAGAQGLSVDAQGSFWVGAPVVCRVGLYDAEGRIRRGWHAPVGKGARPMAPRQEGGIALRVGAASHAACSVVTAEGGPATHACSEPEHLRWAAPNMARGEDSSWYSLEALPPRVVRYASDGTRVAIVSRPGVLALALHSFTGLAAVAVALALLGGLRPPARFLVDLPECSDRPPTVR